MSDELVWRSKKVPGTIGNTYYTQVEAGGTVYRFTIDQPSRQYGWVLRGWANGDHFMYRDRTNARTLGGLKKLVEAEVSHRRVYGAADLKKPKPVDLSPLDKYRKHGAK